MNGNFGNAKKKKKKSGKPRGGELAHKDIGRFSFVWGAIWVSAYFSKHAIDAYFLRSQSTWLWIFEERLIASLTVPLRKWLMNWWNQLARKASFRGFQKIWLYYLLSLPRCPCLDFVRLFIGDPDGLIRLSFHYVISLCIYKIGNSLIDRWRATLSSSKLTVCLAAEPASVQEKTRRWHGASVEQGRR